ncbi:hypothetical protein GQR36_27585 [Enterococcus termitis]
MEHLKNKVDNKPTSSRLKQYYNEFDLAMFRLLAFSGIRVGEALALSFSDFDFSSNTLEITKTMSDSKDSMSFLHQKPNHPGVQLCLMKQLCLLLKNGSLGKKNITLQIK